MSNLPIHGAVDLAALAAAKAPAAEKVNSPFVVDVTDQTFEELLTQVSTRVPVILDLWATWCQPCKQLSPILEKLAVEGNGSWVLAKLDVDANPAIAQAFKVQSIPSVYLLLGGQVQPLFQGVQPESAIKELISQILKVAKDQNLPGLTDATDSVAEPEPVDPAEEKLLAGDLAGAESLYRERLQSNPGDSDAKAGLALISLQLRIQGMDLVDSELPAITDIAGRLNWADCQIALGKADRAYQALIETIANTVGAEREPVKARLLELFEIADPADPAVLAARRSLASALY